MDSESFIGAGEEEKLVEYKRAVEELKKVRQEVVEELKKVLIEPEGACLKFPEWVGSNKMMFENFPELTGAMAEKMSEVSDAELVTNRFDSTFLVLIDGGHVEKVLSRLKGMDRADMLRMSFVLRFCAGHGRAADVVRMLRDNHEGEEVPDEKDLPRILVECARNGQAGEVLQMIKGWQAVKWESVRLSCEHYLELQDWPRDSREGEITDGVEIKTKRARDFVIDNGSLVVQMEKRLGARGWKEMELGWKKMAEETRENLGKRAVRTLEYWLTQVGVSGEKVEEISQRARDAIRGVVENLDHPQLQFLGLIVSRSGFWNFSTQKVLEMSRFAVKTEKTGSTLHVMKMSKEQPVVLINSIEKDALKAWRMAAEMGIPVAPILERGRKIDDKVRVVSRYCGISLREFDLLERDLSFSERLVFDRVRSRLEKMKQKTLKALVNVDSDGNNINHVHPHDGNFVIEIIETNYLNEMLALRYDLNTIPWRADKFKYDPRFLVDKNYSTVLRLIDWDAARIHKS